MPMVAVIFLLLIYLAGKDFPVTMCSFLRRHTLAQHGSLGTLVAIGAFLELPLLGHEDRPQMGHDICPVDLTFLGGRPRHAADRVARQDRAAARRVWRRETRELSSYMSASARRKWAAQVLVLGLGERARVSSQLFL